MHGTRTLRDRMLRWFLILILVGLVTVYLIMPIGFGIAAVLPGGSPVGTPPVGFETISLTTTDGLTLQAWYHAPTNGAVIVLVHGSCDSREGIRAYAELLALHGYGVLAPDLRGHGASEGRTNRFGWQGTADVGAAVAFLNTQADVKSIGALGVSLGGEILLGAASTYPELRAIVAEGATHRCLAEVMALDSERPLVRNFVKRVVFATVGVLTGETAPYPLLDSMQATAITQFYLIAGGSMPQEIAYNSLFATTLGERAELWIAPETMHIGAFSRYPQEYEQRVVGFFDAVLLASSEE